MDASPRENQPKTINLRTRSVDRKVVLPEMATLRALSLMPSALLWLRLIALLEFSDSEELLLEPLLPCRARPLLSRMSLSALTNIPCLGLQLK